MLTPRVMIFILELFLKLGNLSENFWIISRFVVYKLVLNNDDISEYLLKLYSRSYLFGGDKVNVVEFKKVDLFLDKLLNTLKCLFFCFFFCNLLKFLFPNDLTKIICLIFKKVRVCCWNTFLTNEVIMKTAAYICLHYWYIIIYLSKVSI